MIKHIDGGVTAALGYMAAGVSCGIKKSQAKDIALITSDPHAIAIGMFTTNTVKAAPVLVSMRHIDSGRAGGIVISSGNANACTGDQGLADALAMCQAAAPVCSCPAEMVLVASTGVIGAYLPMENVSAGINAAGQALNRGGGRDAAEAIMTTDTVVKESAVEVEIGKHIVRLGGMAKGVGMIAPNMATMIAVVATDADISAPALRAATQTAVETSFNCVTIDGDMSTNDSVFVLANGAAGNTPILEGSRAGETFAAGLRTVMADLAEQMVRDGEEATKFVRVTVNGADCYATAKRVAMKIGDSVLVKCALFGQDANWGRIAAAAGAADADFDPDKMDISINNVPVMQNGGAAAENRAAVDKTMTGTDIEIAVNLNQGDSAASILTTDLSVGYVKFNAHYRT